MTSPAGQPPATDSTPPARPRSPQDLFLSFTWLALQGFGGVLAVVQRVLVEDKRWLTREEFVQEWAVAQVLPGPNIVNLALMMGDRYFGWRGAFAALGGILCVPLLVVLVLALLHSHFAGVPQVEGALRGMGAVTAGLITATGLKLTAALRTHPLGPLPCALLAAATFVAIALLRWPLGWVLLGLGGPACVLTWWRLPEQRA
ncbi:MULTISPECIES: chromate transporter [Ramlibacter]|uniref:Chromate transporter n=1 Tax=Ramlibacter aquaticus TaxID=2780094 RepID=A0ABR9SIA4_9BURK|nr:MULTISPECIES: chromate transporter [Ramlibacter]MBE7942091.1 chromate transporter [Ramlibacter aquaticus]